MPAPTAQPLRWIDSTKPGTPQPTITPYPSPTSFPFSADCGDLPTPKCSIDQIRNKVNFTIKELGTIPEGLYFIGATGGPDGVYLLYDTVDHSGFISLKELPWADNPEQTAWQVGSSAIVETVDIGGLSGEYVKGLFSMKDGDTTMTWDENVDIQTLHWVDHGVFVEMQSGGSALSVDRNVFVSLAENLTTKPISAGSLPMPTPSPDTDTYSKAYPDYTLTLAEAEQRVGFHVLQPGKLPDSLQFGGAMYDPQGKVVSIAYLADLEARLHGLANGLALSQQVAPNPDDCGLCVILVGDITMWEKEWEKDRSHLVISPDANLETVQIGALTGQYVEGHWFGDGVWTAEDIKTLRWRKDGMAFELSELGTGLTKADLITIAESIK
jgi:hypothetical protein